MKKISFLFVLMMLFLASCEVQNIALKGNYDQLHQYTTQKNFGDVWSNIIDLFAQKGVPIGIVDKSSGLITSKEMSFLNSYTFEKQDGAGLDDPNAWIVISKVRNPNYNHPNIKPTQLNAEWNVRIKETDNGTMININLVNIAASAFFSGKYGNVTYQFNGKSTGIFEKWVFDQIK